ncbi:hypothetical protein [Streptomyces sp. S186]|uniref:hypothetical protein n=1 Tax=Streptomyces sp. S186 TaxID=3434395 RepID=UPI003F67B850
MTADPSSASPPLPPLPLLPLLPVVPVVPLSVGAERLVVVSRARDRALTRSMVVRRLLALEEAGTLQTVHVRIAASTAGPLCGRCGVGWL